MEAVVMRVAIALPPARSPALGFLPALVAVTAASAVVPRTGGARVMVTPAVRLDPGVTVARKIALAIVSSCPRTGFGQASA